MNDRKRIAFLGLGAMGSRMASRLIEAGHQVTVWNRNPARTLPLSNLGAVAAETPRLAVRQAEIVIAMVRDDTASSSVWLDSTAGALTGMQPNAIAIEASTLTIGHVRNLATAATAQGIRFIDAPVAGSLPQAEAGQLVFMAGGDATALAEAAPLLMAMGSRVHHAGDTGAGVAVKLAVNALLAVQVAAVAELGGMLKANHVELGQALEIINSTPVASPAIRAAANSILTQTFTPLFPVELAEKDLGYAEAARADGLPMTSAARAVMNHAISAGYGKDHLTGIARLY